MGLGPHTLLERPAKLKEILGKPTGQGFGAARKGPSVVGKPQDVVIDEDYQQGNLTPIFQGFQPERQSRLGFPAGETLI